MSHPTIQLLRGDSRHLLKDIAPDSLDSCVTDPPYALVSIVKRFGKAGAAPAKGNAAYTRASAGFMGQQWDTGETAFDPDFWREVYRVLKPGAHLAAFSGTRTYHRMAVAIEEAGFEIRDQIGWTYGAGFPKSHNVKKGVGDRACQCEAVPECDLRSVRDTNVPEAGTAGGTGGKVLQPSLPQQGSQTAVLRAEPSEGAKVGQEPSLEGRRHSSSQKGKLRQRPLRSVPSGTDFDGSTGRLCDGTPLGDGDLGGAAVDQDRDGSSHGSSAAEQSALQPGALAGQPESQIGGTWPVCGRCGKPVVPAGLGTALKPAWEPICLARKPLSEPTVAANVLRWGTGALNITRCRVPVTDRDQRDVGRQINKSARDGLDGWGMNKSGSQTGVPVVLQEGRWPANIVHDGSDDVVALFPQSDGQQGDVRGSEPSKPTDEIYGQFKGRVAQVSRNDSGSAARFFYTAKADAEDRLGSSHPTVKPVDLMQWLVRMVTPRGGITLDPFAGTGTAGEAAFREGVNSILVEREERFAADIERRISLVMAGPDERAHASIKAKIAAGRIADDAGPLFNGTAA